MIDTLPILEDEVVKLEPFEIKDELDLVINLIMKCRYTKISYDQAKEALLKFETIAWKCYDKATGVVGGVAYLTKTPMYCTLDAYKDDELMKSIDNAMDYSYRVGKLVSDYALTFTDVLMTCHAFHNRGATIVCKKLGFKEDFILMRKDRYGV